MALVQLEIPPRSPYVGVVRLALSSLARAAGLDEEKVDDIKIAVSEACANAVISNEEAGSDDPVTISWDEYDHAVRIEVADRGAMFNPDAVEQADSQGFSTRAVMSMALLKSLVDECQFEPRTGGGTTTRLQINR